VISESLRLGKLDIFTNYFMRLPKSGSLWMPDDAIGHYRHWFTYEMLFELWTEAGKPGEQLLVTVDGVGLIELQVVWDGETPQFLYPHGYLFLDWVRPVISRDNQLALVITGTGTSKTSSIAVAALAYCVLYPGFNFMNVAPSTDQATLMIDEMEKWVTDTPYSKFVERTRSGELFIKKPYPIAQITSPFAPQYPSRFACQTVGGNADNILGKNQDWVSVDEVQLMVNIDQAIPKLMTRMRAQRADGTPRWAKISMLTNPGNDRAELDRIRKRIEKIRDDPDSIVNALYLDGIDSTVNFYVTRGQWAFQRALMDSHDINRWQRGLTTGTEANRELPESLLNNCLDEEFSNKMYNDDKAIQDWNVVKTELGVMHYHVPYEDGHYYVVTGDPGKGNPDKLSLNNIPIVTVFDVTDFLTKPARLVHFSMIWGNGSYKPWLEEFKRCMRHYQAQGFYDATNLGLTGFEDAGAFDDGFYTTTPITFAANNKKWARSAFVLLAQDGQFAWPFIDALWYQAAIYRETGEGKNKLADDILASIFVYTLSLRIEGTFWDKLVDRYHWDEVAAEEDATRQDRFYGAGKLNSPMLPGRAGRGSGSRYSR